MKKLLGIIVLGLLLGGNANADDEKAVSYGGAHELPEDARPNDATISLFEERKKFFIEQRRRQGRLYTVAPKGNAKKFVYKKNLLSSKIENQLSEGFFLSYLYYDNGVIKYDGTAADGRFKKSMLQIKLYFTHTQPEKV